MPNFEELASGGIVLSGSATTQFDPAPYFSVDAAVYQYLSGKASITDLVGDRLYRDHLPQPYDWSVGPAISLFTVSQTFDAGLDGSSGIARARVQIDVWAASGKVAARVTEAIRLAMQGYRGVLSNGVQTISTQLDQVMSFIERSEDGSDQWNHHRASDYMVRYRIRRPQF